MGIRGFPKFRDTFVWVPRIRIMIGVALLRETTISATVTGNGTTSIFGATETVHRLIIASP